MHQEQKEYEFSYPIDQQLCENHRLATRIWRGITDESKEYQICKCCNRKVGQRQVQTRWRPNSSEFSFLGPGIPLYFKFIKYSIALLVMVALIFSIYGLYTNNVSKNCSHNQNCVVTIFNSISIINKKSEYTYLRIQNYILLAFVICCFILLHLFRYRFRKVEQNIDKINVSASDYAIILKRLPNNSSKDEIEKMINNQLEAKTNNGTSQLNQEISNCRKASRIESIVLSYDVTHYLAKKQEQLEKFKQSLQEENKSKFTPAKLPQPKELGQIAIVVFSDQDTKNYFIHEPSFYEKFVNYFFSAFPPLSNFQINGKKIAIERAPQPEDILWQNAHISPCERTKRKIFLNCISFILLMIGGGCQYGLALWQTVIEDPTAKVLIGTVASITVTITNTVLQFFLVYSTKWERVGTQSQYLEILTFKLVIQQFLNAGVFVVAANVLADFSDSMLENSLADTITQIMILNALTPNVSTFVMKKFDIIGKVKRYIILKSGLFVVTQMQANRMYQMPKPDFTQKYGYIVKTLWLTAFYAPFVPVVAPISVVGLTINYFVEKYLFGNSYSVSSKISSSLNNICMEGLEYIPLIFSIGQFLIYIYFQTFFEEAPDDWLIPIYVSLALSFTNLILPMQEFNEKLQACLISQSTKTFDAKQQKTVDYHQAIQKFQITYEMTYPASKIKRGKRKDTFLERRIRQFEQMIMNKQKGILNFNILGQPNANLLKQQQDSQHNIHGKDYSNAPSTREPKLHDSPTDMFIIKKRISSNQETIKDDTELSTRNRDTQVGSVSDIPFKFSHGEPEPGKLAKETQEQSPEMKEEMKKLFDHLEHKKAANKLIQIKEENQEDQKQEAV